MISTPDNQPTGPAMPDDDWRERAERAERDVAELSRGIAALSLEIGRWRNLHDRIVRRLIAAQERTGQLGAIAAHGEALTGIVRDQMDTFARAVSADADLLTGAQHAQLTAEQVNAWADALGKRDPLDLGEWWDELVGPFAFRAAEKLREKERVGYRGWDDPGMVSTLETMLREHVDALLGPDPAQAVDVANVAMFLEHHYRRAHGAEES